MEPVIGWATALLISAIAIRLLQSPVESVRVKVWMVKVQVKFYSPKRRKRR